MIDPEVGVWLVGALGNLATTVMAGARAIAHGLAPHSGILTARDEWSDLPWAPIKALRFGGHEIRRGRLADSAAEVARSTGSLRSEWLEALAPDLASIDPHLRPGLSRGAGLAIEGLQDSSFAIGDAPARRQAEALAGDLNRFRDETGVERLVVVNLASTEPPAPDIAPYRELAELERALDSAGQEPLRPAVLYSYAALQAGAAYVNFTPSNAALCPAVQQLADQRGLPYMGNDGKTGETLVKSALAPMFRHRDLQVDSWVGYNLLGNRDGEVLAAEENKQSKVGTKDSLLTEILGAPLCTKVGIDYVPSLDDRKVAWDFIHFRGFLDYQMSMQFTWQGCDSVLAAPLVLDLVRLADLALQRGESGPMAHLACYFKSPLGCATHDLHAQYATLGAALERYRSG